MSRHAQRENFLKKLTQSDELKITVTGRRTGRKFSTPVWFVLDGEEKVILVPTKGADNNWFKNLVKNPLIELGVGGIAFPSRATLVRDSSRVKKVIDQLRAKYESMWSESYYAKREVFVEIPL